MNFYQSDLGDYLQGELEKLHAVYREVGVLVCVII